MEQSSMPMENIKFYSHATGALLVEDPQHDVEARFGAPFWQVHRADLHKVLLDGAREMGTKILMGRPVKGYDWEGPSAVLGNGETVEADVILAADGGLALLEKPAASRREEMERQRARHDDDDDDDDVDDDGDLQATDPTPAPTSCAARTSPALPANPPSDSSYLAPSCSLTRKSRN
jgi:2-polyprenyl-6-methoxyphenol hydroxylase-like FAD-dependent oxidoreductase